MTPQLVYLRPISRRRVSLYPPYPTAGSNPEEMECFLTVRIPLMVMNSKG